MSIQSNFPNLKPSLLLDFANTKQLDNRVTFTRSTPAVYYDGKTTAMAEQNLLLNSKGFGSSNNVSATLSADASTAPDGTTTATSVIPTTSNSRHIMYQYTSSGTTGSGQQMTASAYIKANGYNYAQLGYFVDGGGVAAGVIVDLTSGSITQVSGTLVSYSSTSVGSGWYRVSITFQQTFGSGTGIIIAPSNSGTPSLSDAGSPTFAGNGTSGNYFWGIQMEVRSTATAYTPTTTQTITNYIPVLLTAGGNQARFDHNPTTGESLGLLIEEQRTNLVTYSAQFDQTSMWAQANVTITANTAIAPDGTLSADKIILSTGTSVQKRLNFASGTYTANTYTLSVYAKAGEYGFLLLALFDTTYKGAVFNLNTGVIGTTSGATASITSVGNGWYRCVITATATTTLNNNPTGFWPTATDLGISGPGENAGNGFNGLYMWGAQLEVGAFATSYIETTSASATRTADVAQMTGTNFSSWFNNLQGTFVATVSAGVLSNGARICKVSDTDANRLIDFFVSGTSQGIFSYQNGITSANFSSGTIGTTKYLTSVSYLTGNISGVVNGGTVTTSTSAVVSSVANSTFAIGYDPITGSQLSRPIAKIAYYPIQVTSANLQALTS